MQRAAGNRAATAVVQRDTRQPAPAPNADPPSPPVRIAVELAGPAHPDGPSVGPAHEQQAPFSLDPGLHDYFEDPRRIDPDAQRDHLELLAGAEVTRFESLQFSYTPGSLWAHFWEGVMPVGAIGDAFRGGFAENPYASDASFRTLQGWIAGAQTVLEAYRGIRRVLGEILGSVSTWAGMGALVLAWFPKAAAVALAVSVLANLGTVALNLFDSLAAVVQLLLNITRARLTDDPVERARLCLLMKKESNDFTGRLHASVVGLLLAAVPKGGKAAAKAAAGLGRRLLPKLTARLGGRQAPAAGQAVTTAAGRAGTQNLRSRARAFADRASAKAREAGGKVAESIPPTRAWLRNQGKDLRRYWGGRHDFTRAEAVREGLKNLGTTTFNELVKGQAAIDGAKSGGGPPATTTGAEPTGPSPRIVYWPSILERMAATRAGIPPARDRMLEQYQQAQDNLGDGQAALRGTPDTLPDRIRAAAQRERARAAASHPVVVEAGHLAQAGQQRQDAAQTGMAQVHGAAERLKTEAGRAESLPRPQPDEERGWLGKAYDTASGWARKGYDATLGKVFSFLSRAKTAAAGWLTDKALDLAGMSEGDRRLAGMQETAERETEANQAAQADADEATTRADDLAANTALLQERANDQEHVAIQGMLEAMYWIQALDTYDDVLAQHEEAGTTLLQDHADRAAEHRGDATVTRQYVEPALALAREITEDAATFPGYLLELGFQGSWSLADRLSERGAPWEAVQAEAMRAGSECVGRATADLSIYLHLLRQQTAAVEGLIGTDRFAAANLAIEYMLQQGEEYFELAVKHIDLLYDRLISVGAGYAAAAQDAEVVDDGEQDEAPALATAGTPDD